MAGHSKWKQIRHKKALTDAKKGQLFSKAVREITIAAREGGSNPDSNPRLRSALERARLAGLPKDNIERTLLRSSGEGDGVNLQEFTYEAMAPGGVMLIIEGATDNKNRTLAEVRKALDKYGAGIVPSNSLLWNFKKVWTAEGKDYRPLTPLKLAAEKTQELVPLLDALTDLADVEEVYTNLDEGVANRV